MEQYNDYQILYTRLNTVSSKKTTEAPPLKNRENLADQARREIERMILEGGLRPDHHLIEAELAARLGISRTPLREALRQLEVKGLLKRRQTVGYTVVYHSPRELQNTFEVRLALESCVVRLACERATREQLNRAAHYLALYDRELKGLRKEAQKDALFSYRYPEAEEDWNSAFHREIYHASGNELLTAYIMNIRDLERLKRIAVRFTLDDLFRFQEQHYALLQALKERNKRKAVQAVQTHIQSVYRFYFQFA